MAPRPALSCCCLWLVLPAWAALLNVLDIKHQPPELFFDEPDLPGLLSLAQVLQIVVTIDVDYVEFLVFRVVSLFPEPCVEGIAINILRLAPQDQHPFVCRIQASHDPYTDELRVGEARAQLYRAIPFASLA